MKLFIVCSRLGYGGAEHVAVMWANGFAKKGYDVTLVSNLYEDVTYHIHTDVKIRNLNSSVDKKLKKWGSAIKNVRTLAKEENPDVIIGVMRVCSMVAKIAVIGLDIPVVATEHNAYEWPNYAPMPFGARMFKFHISKCFDTVTVLTNADMKILGNKLKKVIVMPNPIELSPLQEVLPRKRVVLAAGRLDAWHYKGFDVLIKAWGSLMQANPHLFEGGWRLQIAGTGESGSSAFLNQLCCENGVEEVVDFLGFKKDMETLYRQSDVFVLSSRYEGFGLVLIEAMSQGCACVACDYKGRQREIIQDESMGLTCEPNNVDALAESLKRMMENEDYRESIRLKAIDRAKCYSVDNIMERWESLFKQILKN